MEKRITRKKTSQGKLVVLMLSVLLFSHHMLKAQPVMDGNYDPNEGWGEAVASNPDEGWAGANAINLYVTSDANYIYFGAELQAAAWQSWGFAINHSQEGGISSDVWALPHQLWPYASTRFLLSEAISEAMPNGGSGTVKMGLELAPPLAPLT